MGMDYWDSSGVYGLNEWLMFLNKKRNKLKDQIGALYFQLDNRSIKKNKFYCYFIFFFLREGGGWGREDKNLI